MGQTPPRQTPPSGQTPPPRQTPPSDTTGYGQQAGYTHPTGMHTCLIFEHSFQPKRRVCRVIPAIYLVLQFSSQSSLGERLGFLHRVHLLRKLFTAYLSGDEAQDTPQSQTNNTPPSPQSNNPVSDGETVATNNSFYARFLIY